MFLVIHTQSLNLSNNVFTGTLPVDITTLTRLTLLDASHNSLNGSLPSEIGDMTWLVELDLSYNLLSVRRASGSCASELFDSTCPTQGTMPEHWFRLYGGKGLMSLANLSLSHNRLNSTLPVAWGAGEFALQKLFLDQNSFSGSLPNGMKRI